MEQQTKEQTVTLGFTSWIVHAMESTLPNQRKKYQTQLTVHQQDSMKGDWNVSGDTEHTKDCNEQFNWLNPKALAISAYMYEKKVREAL